MLLLQKKPQLFKIKPKEGGTSPFNLNKIQKQILNKIQKDIDSKGRSLMIIPKPRQGGITTLGGNLCLSFALTEPAIRTYLMAHDSTTAGDIFDNIIKFSWLSMDKRIKSIYKVKRDNRRELVFENNESSYVKTGTSPRGTTVDVLWISEAGKMSMDKNKWTELIEGALPASRDAKVIVWESTCDGGLGEFYERVMTAEKGKSAYSVFFFPWYAIEEYKTTAPENDKWLEDYQEIAKTEKLYKNPIKQFGITRDQLYWYYQTYYELKQQQATGSIKVQYPFTLEEAFISKARNKFDLNKIKNITTIKPIENLEGIKIYRPYQQGMIYSIGIDVARGGINAGDYSAFTMRPFHKDKNGQRLTIAQFEGRLEPDQYARLICRFANWYNNKGCRVYLTPEVNFEKDSIIKNILKNYDEDLVYKRFVLDPTKQYDSLIPDYGWNTTGTNRSRMIDEFTTEWRNGVTPIETEVEKKQALSFVFVPNKNNPVKGRYDHLPNEHDDVLFSDFLCNQGFDYIKEYC